MLLNLYLLIIIISVQTHYCVNWKVRHYNPAPHSNLRRDLVVEDIALKQYNPRIRKFNNYRNHRKLDGKRSIKVRPDINDVKFFEDIREFKSTTPTTTTTTTSKTTHIQLNFNEIRSVLTNLIRQINQLENYKKRAVEETTEVKTTKESSDSNTLPNHATGEEGAKEGTSGSPGTKGLGNSESSKSKECGGSSKPQWGEWTEWSACSVTCGKGREIRWRHCKGNCDDIETEMEEKICQLPACGPGKLFGVLNL